jgi:predicted permease
MERLSALFRRDSAERELDEELRFHLNKEIEKHIRAGVPRKEARRIALRDFGGLERFKEEVRDERGVRQLEDFISDIRYALRTAKKQPLFTCVVVLTLALGIGATTAIFSVLNGVVLRPLPYNNPDELVTIWASYRSGGSRSSMSQPDIHDIATEADALVALAGYSPSELALTGIGDAEAIPAARVTNGLFEIFQVAPVLGRDIRPEENVPGGPTVVVIGHAFWRDRLGSPPDVLGTTIELNAQQFQIVGVAPPGFDFPSGTQLWIPRYLNVAGCGRDCHFYRTIARTAPGVGIAAVQRQLTTLAARLEGEYPESNFEKSFNVVTLEDVVVGGVRTGVLVLFSAVGIVLLISCANVANLLLARASTRTGEIAIRSALGGRRGRILQQLFLESLTLAVLGGVVGVVIAQGGLFWLLRLAPTTFPRVEEVAIDGSVLLFALATVVGVAFLFGFAPAFRLARVSIADVLNQGGRSGLAEPHQTRSRSALVVVEVALSLVLLFGAGLLLRSLHELNAVDVGFEEENILTFALALPRVSYDELEERARFFVSLEQQLEALPGIESAGSVFGSPLVGLNRILAGVDLPDRPPPPVGVEYDVLYRVITPGYLETLGIPLAHGRPIEPTDGLGAPRVALVSQSLVDRYYPNQDPIGKQIGLNVSFGFNDGLPRTIVGVVADIRSRNLTRPPEPELYLPQSQMGADMLTVMVRTTPGSPEVLPAIREMVRNLDSGVPVRRVEMLQATLDRAFQSPRFYLTFMGIFAVVAVALATVGLYGVVAYVVSRRTREIGIRIALGAKRVDVIRMTVAQGIRPAVLGVILGLVGAFGASQILRSLLYNVEPRDVTTLLATSSVLLGIVLTAIIIPATRASRVSPTTALRVD